MFNVNVKMLFADGHEEYNIAVFVEDVMSGMFNCVTGQVLPDVS